VNVWIHFVYRNTKTHTTPQYSGKFRGGGIFQSIAMPHALMIIKFTMYSYINWR